MIKKRGRVLFLVLSSLILFTSFVSADIFLINQPDETYNLGDTLNIGLGSDGASGWASVNLVCGLQDKMLFFKYIKDASTSQISAPLTKDFLRGTLGDCKLVLGFNGLKSESFPFKISDKIIVNFRVEGSEFNPGDVVVFNGNALKENDLYVDGNAEITFAGTDLKVTAPIIDEEFSGNLTLPLNLAAGEYKIGVFVSEKDSSGNVTNYGSGEAGLKVKQLPSKLNLEASQSVTPGNEANFKVLLYDQTDNEITGFPATLRLINVNGTEVMSKLANTGEPSYYSFKKDDPYGTWKASAEVEGLFVSSDIYVEQNMEAEFNLENGTLRIRNIGNVPYDKKIEMRIGNNSNVTDLNLSVGKSIEFRLSAPDGSYDVAISDGENAANWDGVALTGKSVSFGSSNSSFGFLNKNIIPWVFVVIILGFFVFISSRKIIQNKYLFKSNKNSSMEKPLILSGDVPKENKGGIVNVTPTKNSSIGFVPSSSSNVNTSNQNKSSNTNSVKMPAVSPVFDKQSDEAMPSSSIDGAKQGAAILAIKIKNYEEIKNSKSNAAETIKDVIREISNNQGKIYKNND
ncbi:MAG: hypothetical protein AABX03_04365, partial [Nanoarchaeota archaeon]